MPYKIVLLFVTFVLLVSQTACDEVLQHIFGITAESVRFERINRRAKFETVQNATFEKGERVFLRINGLSGLYADQKNQAQINMHIKILNAKDDVIFELPEAMKTDPVNSPNGRIEALSAFYDIPDDLPTGSYYFYVDIMDLRLMENILFKEEFRVK